MKLFEELMDKTAKFADEAVKVGKEAFEQTKVVAGEAVEKGKKKVNQLQLESDLRDAYRRLGEEVYVQHKNNIKDDLLLEVYLEEIEKLTAEIELLKTAAVNETDDFTVSNAAYTADEETPVKQEIKEEVTEIAEEIKEEIADVVEEVKEVFVEKELKVCPNCGAGADEDDIFCRECGTKLN